MTEALERGAVLRRFRQHRLALAGLLGLTALVLWVLLGPWVADRGPNDMDLDAMYAPPSRAHPLGTDDLGRDLLVRTAAAGRVSLLVGLCATGTALVIGTVIGALAGGVGGRLDNLLMRGVDVMLSVPTFFVLLILSSFFKGYGLGVIILIIAATSWMPVARLTRAMILQLRGQPLFESARCLGLTPARVLWRHLLPNAAAPLVVVFTLGVGEAILVESALSFLGFGVQPPTATWGNMITAAQQSMLDAPWIATVPGLMILLTVLCINFVGDGLRDALNPRELATG